MLENRKISLEIAGLAFDSSCFVCRARRRDNIENLRLKKLGLTPFSELEFHFFKKHEKKF